MIILLGDGITTHIWTLSVQCPFSAFDTCVLVNTHRHTDYWLLSVSLLLLSSTNDAIRSSYRRVLFRTAFGARLTDQTHWARATRLVGVGNRCGGHFDCLWVRLSHYMCICAYVSSTALYGYVFTPNRCVRQSLTCSNISFCFYCKHTL